MQICSDYIAVDHTFGFIDSVVTRTELQFSQRFNAAIKFGSSRVVLETDQLMTHSKAIALPNYSSGKSRKLRLRCHRQQAQSLDGRSLRCHVLPSEKLIPGADGKHRHAVCNELDQNIPFLLQQIGCDMNLLGILSAADVDKIGGAQPVGGTAADPHGLHWNFSPLQATVQHGDIAGVAVEIQFLGVKPGDPQRLKRQ